VRSFRGADCNTDHYLVVAKDRKIWQEVNKHHKILMGERFNLRKLNELDIRKQYQFEISNRFTALENFSDRAWENIRESTKPQLKRV